jgi:solute carrier family 35 protein
MKFITGGMGPEAARAVQLSLLIATAYGITSMTTSFAFKALLSSWDFDAKFLMLGVQMSLTLSVCFFLQAHPAISALPGLNVPPSVDRSVALDGLWSGVLFVVNIAVGLMGLKLVNVPMFLAIRRTGTVFALLAEWAVLGKVASRDTMLAVALIVVGAVVAGWDSLSRDATGYAWTVANNVLTALAVAYSKKFSDAHGLKGFSLPLYNALVAFPLCLLLAGATGELSYTASFPHLLRSGFITALVAASVLGVWTNYIHFLCGVHIGPLATSIVGNVKDIAATVLGVLLPFGGTPFVPTYLAITGLVASLLGAILFSLAKLKEVRSGEGSSSKAPSAAAPRLDAEELEDAGLLVAPVEDADHAEQGRRRLTPESSLRNS